MTIKKLLLVAAGAVFSAFALELQPVHAHAGHSHSELPSTAPFVDPLNSDSIFYGEPLSLGNGSVRSFVKVNEDGNPLDIGYTFSRAALSGLPELPVFPTAALRLFPPLPPEAPATAFEHLEFIYWSQGHDPMLPGVADLMHEHIDFTFFFISNEERNSICPNPDTSGATPYPCTGDELARVLEPPDPGAIPTDYIQVPPIISFYGLPRAGTAYFDPTDPLDPFTQTVFYGFNEGDAVFIDVPIANTVLEDFATQGSDTYTAPIKQPAGLIYPKDGYFPTNYSLTYNEATEEYTISVGGLTFRPANPASVPEHSSTLALLGLGAVGAVAQLRINRKKTGVS